MHRLIFLIFLAANLAGCGNLLTLKRDLKNYQAAVTELSGTLHSADCPRCVTVLVMLGPEGQSLSYKIFERPGDFKIILSTKVESLFAFHDTNHNLEFDPDEPFAWQALPDTFKIDRSISGLRLDIQAAGPGRPESPHPRGCLFDLRNKLLSGVDIQLGSVTDLAQPRFDPDFAEMGMWQPLHFMQSGFAGIYFLEPYTPKKTPVLFVHGINGSPRDFAVLLQHIDREKYQPWLFYYPSGLEIQIIGYGMLGILNKLWLEHDFKDLHIVAHSMGGLVSRSFLNDCRQEYECDYVRTFTSISSPFGGVSGATNGLSYSPVVMPVWRSMAPESIFLRELFATPLPDGVQHHMLFGFHNTDKLSTASGDGTIFLASQLRLAAQRQSTSLRGFDEDHLSILTSVQAGTHVNTIISNSQP